MRNINRTIIVSIIISLLTIQYSYATDIILKTSSTKVCTTHGIEVVLTKINTDISKNKFSCCSDLNIFFIDFKLEKSPIFIEYTSQTNILPPKQIQYKLLKNYYNKRAPPNKV
tara:strand:+ start:197 stop:535 length:339 start_codon:yes stop_codon:yes gene_type:complete